NGVAAAITASYGRRGDCEAAAGGKPAPKDRRRLEVPGELEPLRPASHGERARRSQEGKRRRRGHLVVAEGEARPGLLARGCHEGVVERQRWVPASGVERLKQVVGLEVHRHRYHRIHRAGGGGEIEGRENKVDWRV